MTTRRRPIPTVLLALVLALSGLGVTAAAPHGAGDGQGLTEVVICGDDGPRTIRVDAAGEPVETEHSPSCCEGPCTACAASADEPAVLTATAPAFSTGPDAHADPAGPEAVPALRREGPHARAPPEDRS